MSDRLFATASVAATSVFAASVLCPASLRAGPIDPPVGPVTSTYKTLTEVEPRIAINAANTPGDNDATPSVFKITQPGSYYLAGNVTGVAGKHGIEITASGVTVDLNGFHLVGVSGMGAFDAVCTTSPGGPAYTAVVVRNGTIRGWGGVGVNLGTAAVNGARVTDLTVAENALSGIIIGNGGSVSDCVLRGNGVNAIYALSGCTVESCTVYDNTGNGIRALDGSTVRGCTVRSNDRHGISVTARCLVISNSCSSNGTADVGAGIVVQDADNRIEGNNCTGNDFGVLIESGGNIVHRNSCSGNTVNWSAVAGNAMVVASHVISGAINGNTGGFESGESDPNANFTY